MERGCIDFVGAQLADCRRFHVLDIVDDHRRLRPGRIVDVSIPGVRVARFLNDLALRVGSPEEDRPRQRAGRHERSDVRPV